MSSLHTRYGVLIFCLLCVMSIVFYQTQHSYKRNGIDSGRASSILAHFSEGNKYSLSTIDSLSVDDIETKEQKSPYILEEAKQCANFDLSEETCQKQHHKPVGRRHTYPYQLVSGVPGSGNDWILWLGATLGFHRTQDHLLGQCEMYHGGGGAWRTRKPNSTASYTSQCVFVKTHEPWFNVRSLEDERVLSAERAAVIFRHPYDSAFSEYKRRVVTGQLHKQDKQSIHDNKKLTAGLTKDLFLDKDLNIRNDSGWVKYKKVHIALWRRHAMFWLNQWANTRPLRIIIYKDFAKDTARQLQLLLQYFGFMFDSPNMHRHCCILNDPFNKDIKRQKSEIDDYKEMLYEKDEEFRKLCEEAVSEVQGLLDKRWPGVYKIKRG